MRARLVAAMAVATDVDVEDNRACREASLQKLRKRPKRAAAVPTGKRQFSFGIITDVQYADIPNGKSFHGVPRYYRHSLDVLKRAVKDWSAKDLQFAVQLGDIVDGNHPSEKAHEGLTSVTELFEQLRCRTWHTLGNHCLYTSQREKLHTYLNIPAAEDGASYYDFSPVPGWRIFMLDSYDVSVLGWPEGHPRRLLAEAILNEKNPNENKNSPDGLEGVQRRFVKFGGGVSDDQLQWLERKLRQAKEQDERAILCTHLPLHPKTAHPNSLLWNFEQVNETIASFAGTVVAVLSGHCHRDRETFDEHGIYYRVFEAVLECPPGADAYGHIDVHENCMVIHGVGRLNSARVLFRS